MHTIAAVQCKTLKWTKNYAWSQNFGPRFPLWSTNSAHFINNPHRYKYLYIRDETRFCYSFLLPFFSFLQNVLKQTNLWKVKQLLHLTSLDISHTHSAPLDKIVYNTVQFTKLSGSFIINEELIWRVCRAS